MDEYGIAEAGWASQKVVRSEQERPLLKDGHHG